MNSCVLILVLVTSSFYVSLASIDTKTQYTIIASTNNSQSNSSNEEEVSTTVITKEEFEDTVSDNKIKNNVSLHLQKNGKNLKQVLHMFMQGTATLNCNNVSKIL